MAYLTGKTIIITGASSGIGKYTALEYAKHKVNLVIVARRIEKLEAIKNEILRNGSLCTTICADVTKEADVQNIIKKCIDVYGAPDILVNNVGKGLKKSFHKIEYPEWINTLHTNLTSVFLCTKEASTSMMKHNVKGRIITISSLAGLFSVPGYSGYCCSKHAVTSFKHSIKWELRKHNITCKTIYPYKVATEFFDAYQKKPKRHEMLPAQYIAQYIVASSRPNSLKAPVILARNVLYRILLLLRIV